MNNSVQTKTQKAPIQPLVSLKDPVTPVQLVSCGNTFNIHELSEFSFIFFHKGTVTSDIQNGVLHGQGLEPLSIRFRPRNERDRQAIKCSFVDLSLKEKKGLAAFTALSEGSNQTRDQLEGMSYEEIAGAKSASPKKLPAEKNSRNGRSGKIVAVLLAMVAILIVGTIIVTGIVKSKGSIPLVNSTLVGNYFAVESLSAGVVEQFNVAVNEEVVKGQVLFYVEAKEDLRDAQERGHELSELDAQIKVYEDHVAQAESDFQNSTKSMAADYDAMEALINQASVAVKFAQDHEDKLRDLMEKDIIGVARFNEAAIQTAQARLELETFTTQRRRLHEKLTAAREDHYIVNDQTQIQRLQSELALGLAKAKREALLARQNDYNSQIPVHAPISGTVSTIYQESGTYVKAGETVIAITRNDNTWAIGHVLAKDAPKVKPGQTVAVRIPSMKATYTGTISGVGHRSVYSQGEWSSDFRTSVPSSTPIKVDIPEIENLPSGLRMEMTVKLDDIWPWQSWLDEKLDDEDVPKAEGDPALVAASEE